MRTSQWHIVGDAGAAKKLLHETMAWCSTIRNAVLVYDQSHWYPDRALWESVQKV
jgi:hypothetical protein